MIGLFRARGFSIDLTHHALYAMGSRMLGFSRRMGGLPSERREIRHVMRVEVLSHAIVRNECPRPSCKR